MSNVTKDRVEEILELGDRRHAEQGRTGAVNLNELLTDEEGKELVSLLMSLPSKKPAPSLTRSA